ncbi:MAG: AAA family ATPase [Methylomicrobium sp.]|nr:AAA family ATPase [Methylomicrobium sp.]
MDKNFGIDYSGRSLANKRFGPFVLDKANARLLQEGRAVLLTPKAFAVLECLVESAGELVTKDRLFDQVWPNVIVTEAALTVCIREIRKALGDSTRQPVYIETVHKRGFRFIGQFHSQAKELTFSRLVGRDSSLEEMEQSFESILGGRRRLIFITGEAGIGKTSLIEAFIEKKNSEKNCRITKGQCIEHHGKCEPYLPILDAIGRLCRDGNSSVYEALALYAPSWLPYFPSLSSSKNLQHRQQGVSIGAESLIRELADALDAISLQQPLIICLEDLHWCDPSTVEFISFWARRTDPAKILLLGTLRQSDTIVNNLPLRDCKHDLQLRGLSTQLPLEFLSLADTTDYLSVHFQPNDFPATFAAMLHRQTDGNPLFIVNVLADLQNSETLKKTDTDWHLSLDPAQLASYIPENLQAMINHRIERLAPDLQDLLKAASVASEPGGTAVKFTLDEAAAALSAAPEAIEDKMERLAKQGLFLRFLGVSETPYGNLTGLYEFTHALYQNVIHAGLSPIAGSRQHYLVAQFLESNHQDRNAELTHKLAVHFEKGRDYLRSCHYLCLSSVFASRLGGCHEAVSTLHKARYLLSTMPQTYERDRQELGVLQLLAPAVTATQGNAAPEIETIYQKALELCDSLEVSVIERFPVLFGLRSYYLITGLIDKAFQLAEALLVLAANCDEPGMRLEAHVGLASCHFYLGNLKDSYDHAIAGIQLYDTNLHTDHAAKFGLDPGVFCLARAGQTAWTLGFPDRALDFVLKSMDIADTAEHPYSQAFALHNLTLIHLFRREGKPALKTARRAHMLTKQHGFKFMSAWSHHLKAWALALQNKTLEAYAEIDKAIHAPKPEARTTDSFLCLFLAECYWHLSDFERGLAVLQAPCQVLAFEAERLRLTAEFYSLKAASQSIDVVNTDLYESAEKLYRQSLSLSSEQGAKGYSLRSAIGLSRIFLKQRRYDEAHLLLSSHMDSFDEGFASTDWREGEQILHELKCCTSLSLSLP